MTPNSELADVARLAWDIKLEDPYYRMRIGEPVERLPAGSRADMERIASAGDRLAERLEAIDQGSLSAAEVLTHGFLTHAVWQNRKAVDAWHERFPVTPYTVGGATAVALQVFSRFEFDSAPRAEHYLSLLHDYTGMLRAMRERIDAQAENGWRIPVPALPTVRTTLQRIRDDAATALTPPPERLAKLSTEAASGLIDRVRALIAGEIVPAYDHLLEAIGPDYERAAPETVGLWQYPDGDEAYRRAIANHLSVAMDPEALHRLGLEEVARLTAEMAELRARMGVSSDEAEFHAYLKTSPRSFAPSAESLEATYRRHMSRMTEKLPAYFHRTPQAPYDVARLSPSLEAGMSFGYYNPPVTPGATGIYYYNGSGLEKRMQLNAAPLIFHELAPGHHFHMALQAENEALPLIRREFGENVGFVEGWAEYAAGLAGEMGLYDDDYDLYGRLVQERFGSQRLVLDTGLNAFGWSLEKAREYMSRQTLETDSLIAGETLRYSTDMPGQALGYQYGAIKFLELRRRAAGLAGSSFDVRDFHEAVLSEGCLPFPVLEAHIDRKFSGK